MKTPATKVTRTLVAHLKREAKRRSKLDRQPHTRHLEDLAAEHGHANWAALVHQLDASEAKPPADKSPARIRAALAMQDAREDAALDFSVPIDPALPSNFDDTPNQRRRDAEIKAWWNRPFAVSHPDGSLTVRCLDGGAWDRSTFYGDAKDHQEAREIARQKLTHWLTITRRETMLIDDDGQAWKARMPLRPDKDPILIERIALSATRSGAVGDDTPPASPTNHGT